MIDLRHNLISILKTQDNQRPEGERKALENYYNFIKARKLLFDELKHFVEGTPIKVYEFEEGEITFIDVKEKLYDLEMRFRSSHFILYCDYQISEQDLLRSTFGVRISASKPEPKSQGRIIYDAISNRWKRPLTDAEVFYGNDKVVSEITLDDFKGFVIYAFS